MKNEGVFELRLANRINGKTKTRGTGRDGNRETDYGGIREKEILTRIWKRED